MPPSRHPFRYAPGLIARVSRPVVACALVVTALRAEVAHGQDDGTSRSVHRADEVPSAGRSTVPLDEAIDGATTLPRQVAAASGVHVRSTGGEGGSATVSIRGAAPAQTRVLLDGIPLHGAAFTSFDLNALPPELFREIVVHRGVLPPGMPESAAGGVLDLRTGEGDTDGITTGAAVGSFGFRKATVAGQAPLDDSGDHRLLAVLSGRGWRGDFEFFDDLGTDRNPDGEFRERRNAGFDEVSGLARVRSRVGRWRWTTLALGTFRDGGVPGDAAIDARRTGETRIAGHAAVRGQRRRLLDDRLDLDLRFATDLRRTRFDDPLGELSSSPRTWEGRAATHRGDAILRWMPVPWLDVHGSVGLGVETWHAGSNDATEDATRTELPGSVAATWRPIGEALQLEASWRYAVIRDDGDGRTRVGGGSRATRLASAPALALTARRSVGSVSAEAWGVIDAAERQPGFHERFGDGGAYVGNLSLRPESRVGWESGARLGVATDDVDAALSFAVWDRRYEDLIGQVRTGFGAVWSVNIGEAALRGRELDLRVALADVAGVRASGSLIDALNRTPDPDRYNRRLPNRPEWLADAELWGRWRWVRGSWTTSATSGFFRDEANLAPAPSRVEHDVALRLDRGLGGWSGQIEVRNLLDARVEDVALQDGGRTIRVPQPIADWSGWPVPGRSVVVSIGWRMPLGMEEGE